MSLDPAKIKWQPVASVAEWPTILTGEQIYDIAAAPNGDVWLGTNGNGLVSFTPAATQNRYTTDDGLPDSRIDDLAVTAENILWANTYGGLVSFNGQSWTRHDLDQIIEGFTDIAAGPEGDIWFAGRGAVRGDGHSRLRLDAPEKYANFDAFDFAVGPDSTLWFATDYGAVWYKDGIWSDFSLPEQYRVAVGPDGAAYFLDGVITVHRYDDGAWSALPHPKAGAFLSATSSRGFYVAADGAVWRGTDEGVFRYDGQVWQQFTAQDGLPSNKVMAITEDAAGQLWFGTDNGAAYVDPTTLKLSFVVW